MRNKLTLMQLGSFAVELVLAHHELVVLDQAQIWVILKEKRQLRRSFQNYSVRRRTK